MTVIGLAMVAGLGVAGFRAVQRNRGFKLLIGRGLDEEEARTHMSMTAQRNRIGWFAKPEAYAGLDSGDVVSTEDRRAAQKQAELEAIYGGATQGADPNAGFAPSPSNLTSLSQASQSAAAEAAALLSGDLDDSVDESLQTPVQQIVGAQAALFDEPSPAATSVAMPSSVALPVEVPNTTPESVPAEPPEAPSTPPPAPPPSSSVRHTCDACGAVFEIDIPAGIAQAVVACPACNTDQSITVNA